MAQSIRELTKEVTRLKKEKNRLSGEYAKISTELRDKENELLGLKLKKRRVSKDQIYTAYLSDDSSSVDMMDAFESYENGKKQYIRMVLKGLYFFIDERGFYPVIERAEGRQCVGDITMSEMRKYDSWDLDRYVKKNYDSYYKGKKLKSGTILLFETPYLLRAQNSGNRTGYGNGYYSQGTLYGDTDKYCIVGMMKT